MKVGVCVLSKSHSYLGFFSYCFEEKETRSSSLTAALAMPPEPQRTWAARSPPRAPRSPAEAHPASPTQLPASREQVDAPGSPRTRSRANLPHRAASAASPPSACALRRGRGGRRGGGSSPCVSAFDAVAAPRGDASPTIWLLLTQKPVWLMSTVSSFLRPISTDANVSFADAVNRGI